MIDPLFIGEDYDIVADRLVRKLPKDSRILEEVFIAYCQVHRLKPRPGKYSKDLDVIHANLLRRIERLEPIRATSDDSK